MGLDPSLLEILACPHCLTAVTEEGDALRCGNAACALKFAVEDGIPNMLIDDADRACPGCGAERAYDGHALRCEPCKTEVVDPRPPATGVSESGDATDAGAASSAGGAP